jgi:cullin-associated NEDD8-dissociated protein 1
MTTFSAAAILEKMTHEDRDLRFMAISDLSNALQKENFKLDVDSERKIVERLLKMVATDKSSDVQGLAIKCLGPFAAKVQEQQAQTMVDTLSDNLLNQKEDDLRDISSSCLKAIITEIPAESINTIRLIVKRVTPKLLRAIEEDPNSEIANLALDTLNDMLNRFPGELASDYEKIQKAVLPQLTSSRTASRKKAISCLSRLAVSSNDALFQKLMDYLVEKIETSKKADHIRTLISSIGAITRAVGSKVGKKTEKFMPLVIKYTDHDDSDETKENCFGAFEAVILRCPKEATPYLDKIIDLSLKFIKYDPNYAGSDEEEGSDMDVSDGSDEEDDGDDYSDDDDMSWKVRKGSSRCLAAIIQTRPELLKSVYEKVAPTLVARFKEREENVKLDVFATFIDLLKQTGNVSRYQRADDKDSPVAKLQSMVPKIVSGLSKELKQKSLKTRIGCFQLLKELVTVLPGALNEQIGAVVPAISAALADKGSSSPLKIEALEFLRVALPTHNATVFHPHMKGITTPVFKAVGDTYYKITAEALRVCCEITRVLRPQQNSSFDYTPFVKDLYKATLDKLKATEVDQEVKEIAITCMGLIISILGDQLQANLEESLKILLDRLKNEITRLTAVKAFAQIAASPLQIDTSLVLNDVLNEMATFLRKQNRQLKQATLTSLSVIVHNQASHKSVTALSDTILKEDAALISDSDLHLSHLALRLATAILQVNTGSAATIQSTVLPQCLELLKSTLLQGMALESMLALFEQMIKVNAKQLSFESLLETLVNLVHKKTGDLSRQSILSIAQCIAVIVASKPESVSNTVTRFVSDLKGGKDDSIKLLAVYTVGEVGRRVDLSGNKDLRKVVLAAFEDSSEDVKTGASVALGNIAIGNMGAVLPDIFAEIQAHPKKQYLLLGSLREVIVRQSGTKGGVTTLSTYFDQFLTVLFNNTQSEEEGTRNVVSECLGKLALINPEKVIPALRERIGSDSPFTRGIVVTAVKFTIAEQPLPVDDVLKKEIAAFLEVLKDANIDVRRSALLTLNYVAHHKSKLIRDLLPKYLPVLYAETKVRPELIREVDLGPFKHKVDDGLELRKAAFDVMYTLLDTSIDRLDLSEFINHMVNGLNDQYDIKMLDQMMLVRLAQRAGAALLAGLDNLIEPLRQTVTTKVKDNSIQQQVERNEEMIRSALRAVAAINAIPNSDTNQRWADFMKTTIRTPDLNDKFEQVAKEAADSRIDVQKVDAMDLS